MKPPRCLHCGRKMRIYGRGLCGRCYDDPEICDLYPLLTTVEDSKSPLPADPTDAPIGTDRKIIVLQERVSRGESVSHPGDIDEATRETAADERRRRKERGKG